MDHPGDHAYEYALLAAKVRKSIELVREMLAGVHGASAANDYGSIGKILSTTSKDVSDLHSKLEAIPSHFFRLFGESTLRIKAAELVLKLIKEHIRRKQGITGGRTTSYR